MEGIGVQATDAEEDAPERREIYTRTEYVRGHAPQREQRAFAAQFLRIGGTSCATGAAA